MFTLSMFIHYYVFLFEKGIGGAYGQTLCQTTRTVYCHLVWHHIFDILSHLFSSGDPVTMLLETADTIVSQETIDETRAQLGLDKPFIVQYANWVVNAAQGDLGMSYSAKNR